MTHEVVVVGAGPSGASVANEAAKDGSDVLLIEEHQEIGEPVQCAGIVSNRAIDESGITSATLNEVRGALIHSPNSTEIKIESSSTKAHIIDRHCFDKKLVEKALDSGADLWLKTKVQNWDGNELTIHKNGKPRKMEPDVVVGADGVSSVIRRGITKEKPRAYLIGAQVVLKNVEVRDTDFVELFLGKDYAPGFFGWFIPIDEDKGRLGLCVRSGKNPLNYLKKLLEKHPVAKKRYQGEELEYNFGGIPIGYLEGTCFEKTLLVGDAAAQAKPTTGGGVYTGVVCGKIAGRASSKFIDEEAPLTSYEKNWKNKVGGELKKDFILHKIWRDFSDQQINDLLSNLNTPETLKLIKEYGNIDYPSKTFFKLIKNKPSLIKYSLPFLKGYLGELI